MIEVRSGLVRTLCSTLHLVQLEKHSGPNINQNQWSIGSLLELREPKVAGIAVVQGLKKVTVDERS